MTLPQNDSITVEGFDALRDLVHGMCEQLAEPTFERERWQETVEVLERMHESYFASSSGPDGQPWAPLAASTVAKKGHAKILIETRRLQESLASSGHVDAVREASEDFMLFGTRREWAWIHQRGSRRIPQRMHTGILAGGIDGVVDTMADACVTIMFDVHA